MVTSDAAAGPFTVRRSADGTVAFSGTLGDPRDDGAHSGDTVRWADFTPLSQPGTFYLDVEGVGTSHPFRVADDTFADTFYTVMRSYYGQRCGTAVDLAPSAPQYSHPACHTADATFHSCSTGRSSATPSRGGWHDAGDYGKYVVNSGITTGTLLLAYERYADRIGALRLDIPESGDATPDVLDEIRWNLDWMLTMQDGDGGVYHKLTPVNFSGFVLPHDDSSPRFVVGAGSPPYKSSCATSDFAAVMAIAARVYAPFDASFASTCRTAAERAWDFLSEHPNVAFSNRCGVVTGEYGDGDCSDERLWAAAELFRTAGDDAYGAYFLANYAEYDPTVEPRSPQSWPTVQNLAMWTYQGTPSGQTAARETIRADTLAAADAIVERSRMSAYRHSLEPDEYVWGSNGVVANYAVLLLVANDVAADERYVHAALDNLHYLFGRNTHGVSFVTQVGESPARNPHHRPSAADGVPAPWPGLLVGGPNRYNDDGSGLDAIPATPPMRRWVDQTESYASNENAINWNAPLVYALASTLPDVETHALRVELSGAGCGAVTSSPAGIDCEDDCESAFPAGTEVTLFASPCAGSIFAGWAGACSGGGACRVSMTGPQSVVAFFEPASTAECTPAPDVLCLNDGRFRVEVDWRELQGLTGAAMKVPTSADDSGLFWFFDPSNWEMLVKILDGCGANDRYWVFSAATTDVEYTLRVTDTESGEVRVYVNPLGRAAPALTDTAAFATCP
jgi:endoglucanase